MTSYFMSLWSTAQVTGLNATLLWNAPLVRTPFDLIQEHGTGLGWLTLPDSVALSEYVHHEQVRGLQSFPEASKETFAGAILFRCSGRAGWGARQLCQLSTFGMQALLPKTSLCAWVCKRLISPEFHFECQVQTEPKRNSEQSPPRTLWVSPDFSPKELPPCSLETSPRFACNSTQIQFSCAERFTSPMRGAWTF